MKKSTLTFSIVFAVCALGAFANAGTEPYAGKEVMQQAPAPCEWYRAHEWNFNIWGTYAISFNQGRKDFPNNLDDLGDLAGEGDHFNEEVDIGPSREDRFLNRDGAWGGGADVKFFFDKHWGIGAQGFVLDANGNVGGAGLGTVTFRFPIGCSRFAPYTWAGFGVIGGGAKTTKFYFQGPVDGDSEELFEGSFDRTRPNRDVQILGQFGAGVEYRVTKHIGMMADFAYNAMGEGNNDFGLARFGVTLSY